ncbi:MAG: hypothetical protein ACOY94_20895 [Bacillota bacterium]
MEELLDRYRLALALIPDPNAAGDLFMAARSEADLRRRAARWRETQGLPPAVEPLTLPELDQDQREHALHLARRGATHRRATLWLTIGLVVAGLAAGAFLLREALLPRLDAHPAFSGPAISRTTGLGNLTLAIYQAEVTPVKESAEHLEIAIWWEVTGVGAADAYRRFRPELYPVLRGQAGVDWLLTTTTRRYSTRPERVLGVSRFRLRSSMTGRTAIFRLIDGRESEGDLSVRLRLPPP